VADAIEIARSIANNNGRTQYVGRVPSDIEVLAYALLAQQAVVEAAEFHQRTCGCDAEGFALSGGVCMDSVCNEVRAMRETK